MPGVALVVPLGDPTGITLGLRGSRLGADPDRGRGSTTRPQVMKGRPYALLKEGTGVVATLSPPGFRAVTPDRLGGVGRVFEEKPPLRRGWWLKIPIWWARRQPLVCGLRGHTLDRSMMQIRLTDDGTSEHLPPLRRCRCGRRTTATETSA